MAITGVHLQAHRVGEESSIPAISTAEQNREHQPGHGGGGEQTPRTSSPSVIMSDCHRIAQSCSQRRQHEAGAGQHIGRQAVERTIRSHARSSGQRRDRQQQPRQMATAEFRRHSAASRIPACAGRRQRGRHRAALRGIVGRGAKLLATRLQSPAISNVALMRPAAPSSPRPAATGTPTRTPNG